MFKRGLPATIILVLVSLFIAIISANTLGYKVENAETFLYRKISGKEKQHIGFDSTGVPYVSYEGSLGEQYNFVTVAEYVLDLTKNQGFSKDQFFNCIKWLIGKSEYLNDSSIIFHNQYPWPGYKMTPPWRSAMNQGRAMQAFLKAYQITNDTSYLSISRKSMNALFTQVKDGGVTYIDSTGYWYEEYADDNAPQSRVLNGMIVVLQALSDFHKATNDPKASFLLNKGVEAVKSSIHLYDNNGHSNYDIVGKRANSWYHSFHIRLLNFLYNQTNEPIFKEYAQKWSEYREPSFLNSLIHKPTRTGFFAFFTLFAGVLIIVSLLNYFMWFRKSRT